MINDTPQCYADIIIYPCPSRDALALVIYTLWGCHNTVIPPNSHLIWNLAKSDLPLIYCSVVKLLRNSFFATAPHPLTLLFPCITNKITVRLCALVLQSYQSCGIKNDIVRMSIDKVNDNFKHVGNSDVEIEYLLHVAIDQGLWWQGNFLLQIHVS